MHRHSKKKWLNKKAKIFQKIFAFGLFLVVSMSCMAALATTLPGPADINRLVPEQSSTPPAPATKQPITIEASPLPGAPAPKGADKIQFVLRGVVFKHATVFTSQQLQELYAPYIGKVVKLDMAWQIANALTAKYRQQGYFLSRAFVPAQKFSQGTLTIEAVEGSIGEVTQSGEKVPDSPLIRQAIDAITAEKPIRLKTIERQLLLLNDLPGFSFQAVLAPAKQGDGSEARLILMVAKTKGVATLSLSNGGSRYIGPNETLAEWTGSLISLQQTDLSITEVPALSYRDGKLFSANATQKITLLPTTIVDVTAGYSNADPGYLLKPDQVTSQANNGGIGISYRLIRQRDENLSARFGIDFHNSSTYIIQELLSHDHIRAAQWGVNYDTSDPWFGHNYLDVEIRHGLPIFNSSRADDPFLSRPDINPNFTKLQLNYTRLQAITQDWSSQMVITGQKASGALYSSEEFGYGGMAIGRAYDPSEISGDDGISGSIEVHYNGLPPSAQVTFTPYAFYDIGKVWNLYPGTPSQISGASAGPGVSFQAPNGLSGNFYIGQPLTKPVETPLYSDGGKAPRYAFQVNYKF